MKRTLRLVLCLLVSFGLASLASCNRDRRSDSGGNPPTSSPASAGISSSAQVVKVSTTPATITPDGSADAAVTLSISPGFHINANPATFPYLIATEVTHASDPDESLDRKSVV